MRNLITLLLFITISFITKAQNLVPNGNFEAYNSCPATQGRIDLCTGWWNYYTVGTPDYNNACTIGGSYTGVPSNGLGYQFPASGNAYAGIFVYAPNVLYSEFISRNINTLQIGKTYEISISMSMGDSFRWAIDGIQCLFYKNGPDSVSNTTALMAMNPQIDFADGIADTNKTQWVRYTKRFIADSTYDKIAIGRFSDTTNLVKILLPGRTAASYYYLDSLVVRLVPINNNYTGTSLCAGDTIQVPYTINTAGFFNTGNAFTAQLSDANGLFTSPISIGNITSNTSGNIQAVIPPNVVPGLGYRIRIISTSPADSSMETINSITIGKYPNKPVALSNSPVCSGDTLRLNASTTTTGNVTYLWMGPNSFVSTFQNTNISNAAVSSSGSYVVTASILGCGTKDTVVATVNPSPIAITATATTPVCVADTLRLFSANSTTGAAYSWVGPNSFTSSLQNPYIANTTIVAAGDYIATASLSNGCTRKDTVIVQVRPLPANFNAVAGNTCEGNTFFLAGNTSSAGVSFSWTGPNGFTSTLQNPNISPATTAATGNYYVTGMLNGCSIRDTVYGSVYPIPARPLAIANTPVCVGQDLKLNVSNPQSGTYSWQGVGGYSAAIVNPIRSSATTAMAGKYYVTVTANGCASDKDSVMVVVNPAPSINMYPSPKDSICQGATLTFISSTANAGTSYQRYWYRNNNVIGGASNANYSTTTAADNDEYYVTLVATGVCADPYTDTSNKITMRVFPWLPASVSITANPSTTVPSGTMINFTATPVNGGNKPTYQWTRNGNPVVGALSNIWGASTLSHNDEICVNMSSNYLCPNPKTAKSNCIRVSIETTGINGIAGNSNIKVYPNPVRDILNINGVKAGNTIMLYDISGRLLLQQTALANQATINIASVAAGVYQLVIADISTVTRFKITKE